MFWTWNIELALAHMSLISQVETGGGAPLYQLKPGLPCRRECLPAR
jgi:hypothetical protein